MMIARVLSRILHSVYSVIFSDIPSPPFPFQYTLSIHPLNPPHQPTLSAHPVNTPHQSTLSTHPINPPCQSTPSIHPVNPPCQHTLSIHPFSPLSSFPTILISYRASSQVHAMTRPTQGGRDPPSSTPAKTCVTNGEPKTPLRKNGVCPFPPHQKLRLAICWTRTTGRRMRLR